jgi:hypothetical protein
MLVYFACLHWRAQVEKRIQASRMTGGLICKVLGAINGEVKLVVACNTDLEWKEKTRFNTRWRYFAILKGLHRFFPFSKFILTLIPQQTNSCTGYNSSLGSQ